MQEASVMQAVYAAFARFRTQHVLSLGKRKAPEGGTSPSPIAQAEAGAVSMLRHVSDAASQPHTPSKPAIANAAQQTTKPTAQVPQLEQSNEAGSTLPNNGQSGALSPGPHCVLHTNSTLIFTLSAYLAPLRFLTMASLTTCIAPAQHITACKAAG